jgi:hypothetical protein
LKEVVSYILAESEEEKEEGRRRKEGVQKEEVWRMIVHGAGIWILMMSIAIERCKLSSFKK